MASGISARELYIPYPLINTNSETASRLTFMIYNVVIFTYVFLNRKQPRGVVVVCGGT